MYDGLKKLEITAKRKHPSARRAAKYGMILMLCLVVLVGATGVATYRYVQDKLKESQDDSINTKPAPLDGPLNILILGSDSREGLSAKELRELHISRAGGSRSDTIILLRISPKKRQAVLVHFPRDLLVEIPTQSGLNRINSAYAGGPNRVIETVTNLTGMDINYFVEVTFGAFRDLVDAVGGVSLFVPKAPLEDPQSGLNIRRSGCVELDGPQALAFVRARKIYPDQDLGRIQAQQRFMRALLGKVKSAGTILNPFKVRSIANAVGKGIRTSKQTDLGLARSIAGALSDFGTSGVDFRIIPSSTRAGSPYVYVNQSQARAFFAALKADQPLPPYGKTKQSVTDPSDVDVQIFNGAGSTGLAGRESSRLRKVGFQASVGGDAGRRATTRIRYAVDAERGAALVAKYYPGAEVVLSPTVENTDVVVVLGQDAVTPGTASPKAKPAEKPKTPAIGSACG